ncbi:MAG: hypothetical protein MI725_02865 [Pirellulales bacterium]|nr:hypothetical protein [Pirellulales bacterium]
MTSHNREAPKRKGSFWSIVLLLGPILYVLSSGPVIGMAFKLREATGWEWCYGVLFIYYPLFLFGPDSFLIAYIEWWVVDVFQTVGPG